MNKNGYEIDVCPSCGLKSTKLNKDYEAFVRDQYSKGYFTGDPAKNAYVHYKKDKRYIARNLRKFLKNIQSIKRRGRILDVGCALGYFVELAKAAGYDAHGFDPSEYAVDEARKVVGADRIKVGTIGSIRYPPKSFDVITLFDVFEHLEDPRGDLAKLASYLVDDGIIMIATGDSESVFAKIMKKRWTFYNPPQHLFFFHKKAMERVLSDDSLTPIRWFRVGKWLSLRYVIHLASTTGESNFARWLYPLIAKTSFGKIPLFLPVMDNMVVIAKKSL